jgi:RHS repeat-associated protein
MLNDVAGKPIRAWDSRGHNFTTTYDALRRPVEQTVRGTIANGEAAPDPRTLGRDFVVDRIEYGESLANAEALNLRTRIYRHFDSAGVATNAKLDTNGKPTEAYDFKGNLLRSTRRLATLYREIPDWSQNPPPQLDAESFEGSTRYDALNRPIQSIAPHSSLTRAQHPNKINVIQPVFNEANLLERVDVWLERAAEPAALLDPNNVAPSPVGVANIDYDAKGQRQRIDYKNGASTFYSYDPLTFRLTQLLTKRKAANFPDDDPQPAIAGWPGRQVQNLHYAYDPAGNITHIQDDAQQTIYFRNLRVEPSNDYTYDALYRLIQASGREHLGQANGAPNPPTSPDAFNAFHARLDHPGNGNAMGTYIERYVYDAVGNFLQMQHRGSDPAHAGWTRAYDYLEPSLIEDGSGGAPLKTSNRLSRTTLNPNGANPPQVEPYQHDAHGNMVRMPHLGGSLPGPNMHWDYKDQLRQTDLGGGGAGYYVYDASGQRVRKVWEKAPGLTEERIYLGGFEIFRKHGGPIGANTATLERETLHVMDDKQRIALAETRTLDTTGDDRAPRQLIRYQFGNHLGSASLELDEQAQIISYEEYAPYGSSTYQAVRSQTETAKRHRYTGNERDEESGLYYHGARYYSACLGRWTRVDPKWLIDAINVFAYARNNPAKFIDPSGTQCDPTIATCPELMANWSYGTPVPERASVGHNVQRDHPIQVNLRSEQRGGQYTRGVSAARSEQTVLVETGRGYFHTEVGRLQAEINARVRAGVIKTESELIEATREAYRLAGEATGVTVNEQALDRAIVSNLATLSETAEQTRAELSQVSGPTTVSEGSIDQAFRDPSPPRATTTRPTPAEPPATPNASGAASPQTATRNVPTEANPQVPTAPSPSVAASPGRLSRAAAWTAEMAPRALRVVGQVLTVVGAAEEAQRTIEFERRHNRGELNAALMGASTLVVGVLAGVVDDAFAAAQVPMMGAPALTLDSWEHHGSGPVQHAAGEAIRGFLGWSFSMGL